MVGREELEQLAALPEQEAYFSVYLTTDPKTRPRPAALAVFKGLVRAEMERLEREARRRLSGHVDRLTEYLAFSRNRFRQGLALFTCPASDLWLEYRLAVPVPNAVIIDRRPAVKPLARLVDDYQPYAIVLVDRRGGRLFLVRLGEVDVYVEHEHPDMPGKHKKGGWFALSQTRFARHVEYHVNLHLEHVAEILRSLLQGGYVGRVAVAGPPEAVSAFKRYVKPVVGDRLIVFFKEEMFAGWREIYRGVRELMEAVEREREDALVRDLVDRARAAGRAALGTDDVLTNLVLGNIVKLAVAADYRQKGYRCATCGGLLAHSFDGCPFCGERSRQTARPKANAAARRLFVFLFRVRPAYILSKPGKGGKSVNFLRSLEEYRRDERRLAWEGTFRDYLEIVRKNPQVCQLAHSRIYNMIRAAGVEEVNGVKRYRFFSNELFGLDRTLEKLVEEYLHPAARRLDVRKRILLLMGPVSGGKSTLVNLLKRGLERYSRTEEGALYGIKGCPMHEEPLHLIPRELRPDFQRDFGVYVEGELCPVCRVRLETEYGGDIENVPVERVILSEERRVGIGTFSPSDPKSQDIAELTGSVDFSTIAEYGSESDPRAYRFDGELNIANRGIMEFQEMLKCDEKFLWNLLSLSQEGNFKAGRFALIYADEMIVAHTNESEYLAFVNNKRNEALVSRMIVIKVPYTLKVSEEVKIYEKLIRQSDLRHIHIAPHALRVAAIFSVLSRLKESKKQGMDIVKKMKLYDGEDVEGFKDKDVGEFLTEHPDEGMSGVDPRYIINRLSSALIRTDTACINALDVLRALRDGLDQHPSITREERERLLNFISIARREYDEIAKKEVQKAFIYSYEESARVLFNNYLDNVEAYCNGLKVRDPITDEELDPDEKLMRSIEEQIGVTENAKKSFREEILIRISSYARKNRTFDYTCHDRLREAIEKKLFADLKDVVKITTTTKTPDAEQLKRINEVIARLVSEYGYCAVCANELLKYVGSLMNR